MLRRSHVKRAYEARDGYFAEKTMPNLDQAVLLLADALRRYPPGLDDVERLTLAVNLGSLLLLRFRGGGGRDDADTAVTWLREAVEHPYGPQNLALVLLADALEERYVRYLRDEDAQELIGLRHRMLAATRPGHPKHLALFTAFDRARELHAVVRDFPHQAAVPLDEAERNRRGRHYLVAALTAGETGNDAPDLDLAVRLSRRCTATAADPWLRVNSRVRLAGVLLRRYDLTRETADVDEAVRLWKDLAGVTDRFSDVGPPQYLMLDTLARALHAAFHHTGAMHYLEQAVAYGRQAVREYPADGVNRFVYLHNLSVALRTKADRTGGDRGESVRLLRQANDACPDSHPVKPSYLAEVAQSLADAPDEAVELGRAAVRLAGPGHRNRFQALQALGGVLLERGKVGTDAAGLTEATGCFEAAVATAEGPRRQEALVNLAVCHVARYEVLGEESSRRAAVALLRDVAEWPLGVPQQRVDAAREWGHLEHSVGYWPAAAEAYEKAVGLLSETARSSVPTEDRHRILGAQHGLACEAAACFIQLGDIARAVELLELGRGIALGRGIDARSDLAQLADAHPRLAEEFERLRTVVDAMDVGEDGTWTFDEAMALLHDERRQGEEPAPDDFGWRERLVAARDAKLAEIRAKPGFERFLLAPRAADLLAAASQGPIVILNVAHARSDAIILQHGDFETVALDGVTPDSIDRAMTSWEDTADGAWFAHVSGWLWDAVMAKVLARLAPSGHPRVWWCPTGQLASLPLHAAGYHDQPGQSVLDHVISSYTPTIRALVHARDKTPAGHDGRVLAVGMSTTPGESPLPGAAREAAFVHEVLPGRTLTLTGPAATHDSVRNALDDARLAHFACHAVSDFDVPSNSRLLLADHETQPLTVGDISRLRLPAAELAFLSACVSADSGGSTRADEAISLASAFQLAGFPQVVASLWPVSNIAAKRLVHDFYRCLTDPAEPGSAARALHEAVLRYRAKRPEHPWMWAPFIHSGR